MESCDFLLHCNRKLADLLLKDAPSIFPGHNGNLISLVRFPAISRLQKIHNVRLALSAFETVTGTHGLRTAAGELKRN